jgi:hypothetical protein
MAFIDDAAATDFGYMLSYFDCSEDISGTNEFTQTNIFYDTVAIINQRACFDDGVGINNSNLTACNIHFTVGLNSQGGAANHAVKFTYNLHVSRACD